MDVPDRGTEAGLVAEVASSRRRATHPVAAKADSSGATEATTPEITTLVCAIPPMPCPGTKLLEVHHIYGEDSDVLARSRWRAPHGLPQAQPARGIGQAEGMRMGGGELRLRVPREPRKERVIAFRLRVGFAAASHIPQMSTPMISRMRG